MTDVANLKSNFNFVRKYLKAPHLPSAINLLKEDTTTSTLYLLTASIVEKLIKVEVEKHGIIEDKEAFIDHLLYVVECGVKDGIKESFK